MSESQNDPFLLHLSVEALVKPLMIEASAGTGKTHTLTRLVLAYLLYTETPIEQVLVITFTRNATAELKDRLDKLVRESLQNPDLQPSIKTKLLKIAADFDSLNVTTIDAFFQNIFRSSCMETGANPTAQPTYDTTWLEEAARDYFRRYGDLIEKDRRLRLGVYALMTLIKVKDPGGKSGRFVRNFSDIFLWLVDNVVDKTFLEKDHIYPTLSESEQAWQLEETYLDGKNTIRDTYHKIVHNPNNLIKEVLPKYKSPHAESLCELLILLETNHSDGPWAKLVKNKKREAFPLLENLYQSLNPLVQSEDQENPHLARLASYFLHHFHEKTANIVQEKSDLLNLMRLNDPVCYLYRTLQNSENQVWVQKLRKNYKMAFIDEFQDTSHFQWTVLHHLFHPGRQSTHSYALIGDPKQLIYYFRGVTPQTYLQAKQSIEPDQVHALTENYRSHQSVIQALNFWFSRMFHGHSVYEYTDIRAANTNALTLKIPQQKRNTGISFLTSETGNFPLGLGKSRELSYTLCVRQILELLTNSEYQLAHEVTGETRQVQPRDIACLVSQHEEGLNLKKQLDAFHIPCTLLENNSSIYDTEEYIHVLFFLKALSQPFSPSLQHRTLLSPLFGFSLEEILSNVENFPRLEQFYLQFNTWRIEANNRKIAKIFDSIFQSYQYFNRILQQPDGERRFVNMRHLISIILREERSAGTNSGPGYLYQRLKLLKQQNKKEDNAKIRLETDINAVRILNIHQSKGLEYGIVFGIFGLKQLQAKNSSFCIQKDQRPIIDFALSQEYGNKHLEESLEESLRTFYVMATRAKSHLFLPLLNVTRPCSYLQALSYLTSYHDVQQLADKDYRKKIMGDIQSLLQQPEAAFSFVNVDMEKTWAPLKIYEEKIFDSLSVAQLQHQDGFNDRIVHVSSYSSLWQNSHSSEEEDRRDEIMLEEMEELTSPDTSEITTFNMTGGTGLGNAFHAIMENLPFHYAQKELESFLQDPYIQDLTESLVVRHMNITYHRNKEYIKTLKTMVWNTLNTPIPPLDNLCLAELPGNQKLHEVEFLLHINKNSQLITPTFEAEVKEGYIRGFLDLVFLYQDRYYVLDWKTTKLGTSLEAYNRESLTKAMIKHGYDMQARIYLHALMKYLKIQEKEFSYDKIGGALYLFSRGTSQSDSVYGLHTQRLDEKDLSDLFL